MQHAFHFLSSSLLLGIALVAGCQTPDHATEGAVVGGVGGAGVGALIGNASGHAGAGAAIGAGVGALTGAVIGSSEDKAEAQRRAAIAAAAQPVGTVTVTDVITMTQQRVGRRGDHQPGPRRSHGRPRAIRRPDPARSRPASARR